MAGQCSRGIWRSRASTWLGLPTVKEVGDDLLSEGDDPFAADLLAPCGTECGVALLAVADDGTGLPCALPVSNLPMSSCCCSWFDCALLWWKELMLLVCETLSVNSCGLYFN